MQNRYVGDIGDFMKLALLRVLQRDRRLGVAWWLYPDESHNGDGRHVDYLKEPERWRELDPELFNSLFRIVRAGDRRVAALQSDDFLPGATFCDEVIPTGGNPAQRRYDREEWFGRVQNALADRDLVFVDPDNGLETANFSLGAVKAGKCVSLAQLKALSRSGRTLVVYHHQTRRPGGHVSEIEYWAGRLRDKGFATVDAIRSRPFSPRVFFLLDAPPDLRDRARSWVEKRNAWLSWHPDGGSRDGASTHLAGA